MYSSFKYQNPLNLAHSLNSGQAFRWRIEKESSQKWFNGIVDNELIKIRNICNISIEEKKFRPMKNFAKVTGITLLILITLLRLGSTEQGRMKRL